MEYFDCRLSWDNYHELLVDQLSESHKQNKLTDLTIICENKSISCHKSVIAASSEFLKKALDNNSDVLILSGYNYSIVKSLIEFIYLGKLTLSVNIYQEFLTTAKELGIKGILGHLNTSLNANPETQLELKKIINLILNKNASLDHNDIKNKKKSLPSNKVSASPKTSQWKKSSTQIKQRFRKLDVIQNEVWMLIQDLLTQTEDITENCNISSGNTSPDPQEEGSFRASRGTREHPGRTCMKCHRSFYSGMLYQLHACKGSQSRSVRNNKKGSVKNKPLNLVESSKYDSNMEPLVKITKLDDCLSSELNNFDITSLSNINDDDEGELPSEESYTCVECSKIFTCLEEFHHHLNIHLALFCCKTCGACLESEMQLKQHEMQHKASLLCDLCGKKIYGQISYQLHYNIHAIDKSCAPFDAEPLLEANVQSKVIKVETQTTTNTIVRSNLKHKKRGRPRNGAVHIRGPKCTPIKRMTLDKGQIRKLNETMEEVLEDICRWFEEKTFDHNDIKQAHD